MTDDELWFGEQGYDISYEDADGWTWAALHLRSNSSSNVPRYGRGASQLEAVASARRRYEVEQIA